MEKKLFNIKKGEVSLHRFSPTGFYSSAVKNDFLIELEERSKRQTPFLKEQTNEFNEKIEIGLEKTFYVKHSDKSKIMEWIKKGFSKPMTTPNDNLFGLQLRKQVRLLKTKLIVWVVCPSAYLVTGRKGERYHRKESRPGHFVYKRHYKKSVMESLI